MCMITCEATCEIACKITRTITCITMQWIMYMYMHIIVYVCTLICMNVCKNIHTVVCMATCMNTCVIECTYMNTCKIDHLEKYMCEYRIITHLNIFIIMIICMIVCEKKEGCIISPLPSLLSLSPPPLCIEKRGMPFRTANALMLHEAHPTQLYA